MNEEPLTRTEPDCEPPAAVTWQCGPHRFDCARPLIMGVVNVTPDSFSDGGRFFDPAAAERHAMQLIEEGADLLDVGGESTRPGAEDVPEAEELRRVIPLIKALARRGAVVSVDTSKPPVMRAALDAGAAIVNDVNALRTTGAIDVVAGSDCGVVLMHMQGVPRTMQVAPRYDDVVAEVALFLRERRAALVARGVDAARIAFDPGFGFGKTVEQNYALLAHLSELAALGQPLLAGISRKSMLGAVTGRAVEQRLVASVAAALLAIERGASMVRVHDVGATRDALRVWGAMANAARPTGPPQFSGEAN